ncbi:MAG: hypothetical protein ACREFP_08290 [Acetobacteraceae bacterium]
MSSNTKKKMMEKIETAAEAAPARPANPPVPAKKTAKGKATAPQVEETEPARYSSPPCMMGELDEILEE